MSFVGPATLEDILKDIHHHFTGGTDYPLSSEEDYQLRVALANTFVVFWQNARSGKWRELQNVKSDQTVTGAGASSYATDATFKRLAGNRGVKLTRTDGGIVWVPVVSLERIDDEELENTVFAYFSGTPGAMFLNLANIGDECNGAAIRYRYYRYSTKLIDPTDKTDMDDPNYLVHSVVSILFQLARNNTGFNVHSDLAAQAMNGMQSRQAERESGEKEKSIGLRLDSIGVLGE